MKSSFQAKCHYAYNKWTISADAIWFDILWNAMKFPKFVSLFEMHKMSVRKR